MEQDNIDLNGIVARMNATKENVTSLISRVCFEIVKQFSSFIVDEASQTNSRDSRKFIIKMHKAAGNFLEEITNDSFAEPQQQVPGLLEDKLKTFIDDILITANEFAKSQQQNDTEQRLVEDIDSKAYKIVDQNSEHHEKCFSLLDFQTRFNQLTKSTEQNIISNFQTFIRNQNQPITDKQFYEIKKEIFDEILLNYKQSKCPVLEQMEVSSDDFSLIDQSTESNCSGNTQSNTSTMIFSTNSSNLNTAKL